ncbi:MAG: DUF2231 domain-containing protein [Nocardioidaceae bacterium]
MFTTFNGLPLHPLVVHAIVVLLPIAALGTIAIAVWPRLRRRYGWLVVAAGAGSTVLIPVATQSGEYLERQVGDPGAHAQLGDQLIWFAIPLLITSAALVVLDRRRAGASPPEKTATAKPEGASTHPSAKQSTVVMAVAGLAVVAAVATSVQIYRVGDSGARAAWGDTPSSGSGSSAKSGNAD